MGDTRYDRYEIHSVAPSRDASILFIRVSTAGAFASSPAGPTRGVRHSVSTAPLLRATGRTCDAHVGNVVNVRTAFQPLLRRLEELDWRMTPVGSARQRVGVREWGGVCVVIHVDAYAD